MTEYKFRASYLEVRTGRYKTIDILVEANTKWGAWTKGLYSAMEKEEGDYILVKLVCCSCREV